ncbi:retrovirus-related pol polyprotein from transposon TNT 1-94 [Tanacetum coccineum]
MVAMLIHFRPYYQTSKPHKSYAPTSKASLPTRSHATTRYKGKEIAKPITPPSESASEEDNDPEQAQKDKDMQKNLALIAKYFKKLYKPTNNNLRTSSNTRNKNVDTTPRETVGGPVVQQSGIQCFNCKEFGHYAKECRKPKRVKDSTYHKEKMLLCKQAEKGVQLQAEQSDWLADTDEEIDEQELEAHYSYMAKIQEVPNADSGIDAEPLEQIVQLNLFIVESVFAVFLHKAHDGAIYLCCAILFGSRKHLDRNSLLPGNRGSDLYTISLQETTSSTPICLLAKASPTQAWLWHRRLSHLNFDYINLLSKKDIVIGLPKLKYVKDQLCSSCEVSKAKRSSFKSKTVPSSKGRLNLLHMDLCGPMRVASINGKKYILVIVDDYSRYTWTLFLCSKDETPEVLKDFLTMIQRNLQAPVISVRTDRGTEFLNKTLNAFFKEEGIKHQTSTPRTPEQNGVVERRNRTLVEAARTMLSASKLPLFFWAEAIATACYTQNRSIIIPTHEKTAYHIINDRKPSIKHLHIFGCTCYLTRDGENLDKMKEKGDPCILVGYSTQSKGYRVYNKRTRLIVESIHLRFDEIKEMSETSVANDTSGLVPQRQKASDYDNPDPAPELQNVSPSADTTVPSQQELDLLFGPLYDEFFNDGTSRVNKSSSPTDNSIQKDTLPSTHIQPTSEPTTPTNVHAEENNDNQAEFTNPFCTPVQENAESSSRNIGNSDKFTVLSKALYGLKQAPKRLGLMILSKFLDFQGFIKVHKLLTKGLRLYPCVLARTFSVILVSIHNDEWLSFVSSSNSSDRKDSNYLISLPYVLSDLRLRIHKDGDGDASFQLVKCDSFTHCSSQIQRHSISIRDSRYQEAPRIKDKDFPHKSDTTRSSFKDISLKGRGVSKLSR